MGKLKMGIGICTSLLLAAAMSLNAAEVRPQDRAEQAAGRLGRELQEKLMDAMQKSGTAASIDVCARESPAIIDRIEQELGVIIKRTALRVRNPQNAPDTMEKELLLTLTAAQQAGEIIPYKVTPFPDTHRRFYKVIIIQKICLACHGDSATMSEKVRREIAAFYPDDQATGYKEGELRGIFSINVN